MNSLSEKGLIKNYTLSDSQYFGIYLLTINNGYLLASGAWFLTYNYIN